MAEELSLNEGLTLVLLLESAFTEPAGLRCWKTYDFDVMNRLHAKGLISDPVGKAKSVMLTDDGRREAEAARERLTGGDGTSALAPDRCPCGCGSPAGRGGFLPGHDQKLRTQLEARVGGLLVMKRLVDVMDSYAMGDATTEVLTKAVRAAFGQTRGRTTRA